MIITNDNWNMVFGWSWLFRVGVYKDSFFHTPTVEVIVFIFQLVVIGLEFFIFHSFTGLAFVSSCPESRVLWNTEGILGFQHHTFYNYLGQLAPAIVKIAFLDL